MIVKESKIIYEEKDIPGLRKIKLNTNNNIYKYVTSVISASNTPTEYLMVIALDDRAQPVAHYIMGNSSEVEVAFSITSILRFVILSGCDKFITVHNHPDDSKEFSTADIESALHTKKQAKIIELELIGDYLIAGNRCIKNKKL